MRDENNKRGTMGICERCGSDMQRRQGKRFCSNCARERRLETKRDHRSKLHPYVEDCIAVSPDPWVGLMASILAQAIYQNDTEWLEANADVYRQAIEERGREIDAKKRYYSHGITPVDTVLPRPYRRANRRTGQE